jgi:hypothetical protein
MLLKEPEASRRPAGATVLRFNPTSTRVLALGERDLCEGETKGERKRVLLPGFPCPLCNFPAYVWIESLDEELCEAVREDYPAWGPEEGICERCADLYRFRVEFPDSGARGAGVLP